MNKHDITRALIELIVDQGIKDMKQNSHRSIRRMADLGRQFSRGRFQDYIFSLFQRLLARKDSPYYDAVDRLFATTDSESIKRFGMNIGYNAWTLGAATIRRLEAENGREYPWLSFFSWNPSREGSLSLQDIADSIRDGRQNGIYCYDILLCGSLPEDPSIFRICSEFSDCAFFLDFSGTDCRLTKNQLLAIRECPNLMLALPSESPNCAQLAQALSEQKSLFAISCHYKEEDADALLTDEKIQQLLSYGSLFLCFIADPGCSAETVRTVGDSVLEARMEQRYPAFLIEYSSDVERVNHIISA